jgi:hypothetical protein
VDPQKIGSTPQNPKPDDPGRIKPEAEIERIKAIQRERAQRDETREFLK